MDLKLPVNLARLYKSKSQIARVITEAWVVSNVACPNCGSALNEYPSNEKSKDVYCNVCYADFQIKSSKTRFSKRITGAEYNATLNGVRSANNPSLMLLFYDEMAMTVVDFQVIHHSFITEKNIIPRKPLSSTAKRSGWQGCLIDIEDVPKIARIFVVRDGVVGSFEIINEKWRISNFAKGFSVDGRDWLSDVLSVVDRQPRLFSLKDMYRYENHFETLHPHNNNIQAKIRQQLQIIRDMGVLEFIKRGEYKKKGVL